MKEKEITLTTSVTREELHKKVSDQEEKVLSRVKTFGSTIRSIIQNDIVIKESIVKDWKGLCEHWNESLEEEISNLRKLNIQVKKFLNKRMEK